MDFRYVQVCLVNIQTHHCNSIDFLQEKHIASICAKVFQKFPDFLQRCKEEAFEALSDPKYSGKMKVNFWSCHSLQVASSCVFDAPVFLYSV